MKKHSELPGEDRTAWKRGNMPEDQFNGNVEASTRMLQMAIKGIIEPEDFAYSIRVNAQQVELSSIEFLDQVNSRYLEENGQSPQEATRLIDATREILSQDNPV